MPQTHQEAAQSLVDHKALKRSVYADQVLRADREGSHPQIIEFYLALNKELRKRGYPFFATEFKRSDERQNELRALGRSKAAAGSSPHNYGLAVDIIHSMRGWDLSNKQWAVIGVIGKEVARRRGIRIEWGGDWNFYDPAHWQLADWKLHRQAIRLGICQPQDWAGQDQYVKENRKRAA